MFWFFWMVSYMTVAITSRKPTFMSGNKVLNILFLVIRLDAAALWLLILVALVMQSPEEIHQFITIVFNFSNFDKAIFAIAPIAVFFIYPIIQERILKSKQASKGEV